MECREELGFGIERMHQWDDEMAELLQNAWPATSGNV